MKNEREKMKKMFWVGLALFICLLFLGHPAKGVLASASSTDNVKRTVIVKEVGGEDNDGQIFCAAVFYQEWSDCSGGVQTRGVLEKFPPDCFLTVGQEAVRSRFCSSEDESPKKKVLGVKVFANNVLVRGPDKKIYNFSEDKLLLVRSLEDLRRNYAGQKIFNVGQAVIDDYLGRASRRQVAGRKEYADGELIRGSDMKVYYLVNGRRHHVLNLEELRAKHFGREIFNVDDEVVERYEKSE